MAWDPVHNTYPDSPIFIKCGVCKSELMVCKICKLKCCLACGHKHDLDVYCR
jgi:hypothetical protein